MISEKILKILEEERELELNDLILEVKEHPGAVRLVLEKLRRNGKIELQKKKQPHKPKKYKIIVRLSI
ncbi:MAG TPA: hypothetical protein EYH09_01720 [Candidatus Nanopusillus sp.]|nr:hypothetical protein [Candidatus Nanopusillus sp.]HIP90022.1 hypothetical protein [Candidatus Nanopusillus sp.]